MNIKNDLEKSIPANLKMTEIEKTAIRYHIQHSNEPKRHFKPAFAAVLFVMILGVLLLPAIQSIRTSETVITASGKPITDEQKLLYYEKYKEIIQQANGQKTGVFLEVPPIESFQDSDWQTPEQYQAFVAGILEDHLATERKKVAAASSNLKGAITNENGETTKGTFIYFSDILKEIEVTAKFDTEYSKEADRQLFAGIENVTTNLVYVNRGTWEQTSYKASLNENGEKYSIEIEGIFTLNNISYEKAFTLEFSCDKAGKIY
ncbi:hypothetical protein QMK38_14080 [Lysinibacillus fusiformis]|nr:hypothetical protein [Lysinibacillus fusiformis]